MAVLASSRPSSNRIRDLVVAVMALVMLCQIGLPALGVFAQDGGEAQPLAESPLQDTFTFQGRLELAAGPAHGQFDFVFALFDQAAGGVQVGSDLPVNDRQVTDGLFSAELGFGPNAFRGSERYLEVRVRPGSSTGPYETLTPRQELTAAPYALYAKTTDWAGIANKPAGLDNGDQDTLGTLTSCTNGQVPKFAGDAWTCGADEIGAAGTGDITDVIAGAGLTGGASTGSATLNVAFAGDGSANTAARSDHDHFGQQWTSSSVSPGLSVDNNAANSVGVEGEGGRYGLRGTASDQLSNPSSAGVYGSTANFGAGVRGDHTSATGNGWGVLGASINGIGVQGTTGGALPAVLGHNDGAGPGVKGEGAEAGVSGEATDADGVGVVGQGNLAGVHGTRPDVVGCVGLVGLSGGILGQSCDDPGVAGTSASDSGVYGQSGTGTGVEGLSQSGTGVFGWGTGNNGIGVSGLASSGEGLGVVGLGNVAGVRGRRLDASACAGLFTLVAGVVGQACNAAAGVAGWSSSGAGVYGQSVSYRGLEGFSQSGAGVYGQGGAGGVGVEGNGGSFTNGVVGRSTAQGFAATYGANVNGYGVYGEGRTGVYGTSLQQEGGAQRAAVTGINTGTCNTLTNLSDQCIGVYGSARAGAATIGVFGSGLRYGVYSNGALFVEGNATVTGTCSCFASDGRYKRDLQRLPYGLAEVLALAPVTYRWSEGRADAQQHAGFIAQETQAIAPELVLTPESGDLYVDPMAFIAVLVSAVQEQQVQIEGLRAADEGRRVIVDAPSSGSVLPWAALGLAGVAFLGMTGMGLALLRRTD